MVLEGLEGKRILKVFDLIRRAMIEICKVSEKVVNKEMEEMKEEYMGREEQINNKKHRYMITEQYNFPDFNARFYEDGEKYEVMFNEYFSDCGGWEQILLVDMEENKCYLLDKEVKYNKTLVKI